VVRRRGGVRPIATQVAGIADNLLYRNELTRSALVRFTAVTES
jgi:hypothetical protein